MMFWAYVLGTQSESTLSQITWVRSILKTQTSHQTSVDEFRRVQTCHQRNVDECRHQSLDQDRQMQMSEDEPKVFTLIPGKVTHGSIFLLLQLRNSRPHRYANFQFYSFISYYCSSQCFHSSHQQNPFAYVFT